MKGEEKNMKSREIKDECKDRKPPKTTIPNVMLKRSLENFEKNIKSYTNNQKK